MVLSRLIEHNPTEYEAWDLVRLTVVLDAEGAAPVKSTGLMYVDAERVAQALTERDQ